MKQFLVKPNLNIKKALKYIKKTGQQCLVVVNNENKLLGTLSDGDIRNAILKGKYPKDKINNYYQKNPICLYNNYYSINKVKKIFLKNRIGIIPIINKKTKVVVDVLTFEKVFKKNKNYSSISVVIMAGGKGERLKPFTTILPKPLVPIRDKPIIEHIIEKFNKNNNSNFFITVNYKSKILKSFLEEMVSKTKLSFIDEAKPLGTAGSLSLLKNKIKKPFLVTNCDTIVDINFDELINFHNLNKNDLTLVASSKEYKIPYGTCIINKENFLEKIIEKPKFDFFINIGLYVLNPHLLKMIPKNKKFDMTDLISLLRKQNKQIGVYPIEDNAWIDVGQWSEYRKAINQLV